MAPELKNGDLSPEEKLSCYARAYDTLDGKEQAYVDRQIETLIARVKIASIRRTGVECQFSPKQAFEVLGALAVYYAENKVEVTLGERSFWVNDDGTLK